MSTMSSAELLEAAAYAVVAKRCRQSYLHEVRGGLQALNSAVELLARAAKSPAENIALTEKAVSLARRALLNHEQALVELVGQIIPQHETASTVNVGELVGEVLRFIRNDAANKSLTFHLSAPSDILVRAEPHKFRLLMLGLCCTLADVLEAGTVVNIAVFKDEAEALIEITPVSSFPPSADGSLSFGELLLDVTRRWLSPNGGRLDISPGAESPKVLRLFYPGAA